MVEWLEKVLILDGCFDLYSGGCGRDTSGDEVWNEHKN
jgi:hypothetical protein